MSAIFHGQATLLRIGPCATMTAMQTATRVDRSDRSNEP
jgi:hypothetical protein